LRQALLPGSFRTEGNRTTLLTEVSLVNIDDASERVSIIVPAAGCDSGDKAPGKAYTYALKMGLMRLVLAPGGDDTDDEVTYFDERFEPRTEDGRARDALYGEPAEREALYEAINAEAEANRMSAGELREVAGAALEALNKQ
jgi:hypothetical protein